jgi:hypothetical protein
MTPQEQNQRSFDMAAVALVKQGRPSGVTEEDEGYRCLYRGPRGARCAAGWLFEGEVGKDFDEDQRCTRARVAALLTAGGHAPAFVMYLQEAHDSPAMNGAPQDWLATWAVNMRIVAREHNLSTAALDSALAAREAAQ